MDRYGKVSYGYEISRSHKLRGSYTVRDRSTIHMSLLVLSIFLTDSHPRLSVIWFIHSRQPLTIRTTSFYSIFLSVPHNPRPQTLICTILSAYSSTCSFLYFLHPLLETSLDLLVFRTLHVSGTPSFHGPYKYLVILPVTPTSSLFVSSFIVLYFTLPIPLPLPRLTHTGNIPET